MGRPKHESHGLQPPSRWKRDREREERERARERETERETEREREAATHHSKNKSRLKIIPCNSQPPFGMRSVSYEVLYTGIRYKTQYVSSVYVYSMYSVTNTERATWSWFGAGIAGGSLI
jgi:hypothetical protein